MAEETTTDVHWTLNNDMQNLISFISETSILNTFYTTTQFQWLFFLHFYLLWSLFSDYKMQPAAKRVIERSKCNIACLSRSFSPLCKNKMFCFAKITSKQRQNALWRNTWSIINQWIRLALYSIQLKTYLLLLCGWSGCNVTFVYLLQILMNVLLELTAVPKCATTQ